MPKCKALPSYARDFLHHPWEVVLATLNPSGLPQQTVMWYCLEGESLFLSCLGTRKKVRNLHRNPEASALAVGPGCYLSLSGVVEVLPDEAYAQAMFERSVSRYVSPEKLDKMLSQLTDSSRVTLRMQILQYHSHRVLAWLRGQGG